MEGALMYELEERIPELTPVVDTCDEKRMEGCAYIQPIPKFAQGGFPTPGNLFMCKGDSGPEMIGSLSNAKYHENNEQLVDTIRKAVEQGINCAFKVGD